MTINQPGISGLRKIGLFLLALAIAGGCHHSYGPTTTPLHDAARQNDSQGVKTTLSDAARWMHATAITGPR